jgi:hypothetical protein
MLKVYGFCGRVSLNDESFYNFPFFATSDCFEISPRWNMNQQLEELLARIRALEDEIEESYRATREEWERKRQLADELRRRQRHYKVGIWRFIAGARPWVVLTAPVIYLGWIPFLLMDIFVTVYQTICFPAYGIPRVRRADYLVFDRALLPYLNLVEKFNCFYCSYGNGVAAYTRKWRRAPSNIGVRSSMPAVFGAHTRITRNSSITAMRKPIDANLSG